jgi:hypothetical protein
MHLNKQTNVTLILSHNTNRASFDNERKDLLPTPTDYTRDHTK